MSVKICVSYQTVDELEQVDRQLRALYPWRVRDAPAHGAYKRRYYASPGAAKPGKTSQNVSNDLNLSGRLDGAGRA